MKSFENGTALQIRRIDLPTPFPVGPVNAYLIREADQAVLVDCGPGTESAREELTRQLAQEGLVPQDLSAVLLTHGHVDHVGQASWLQSLGVPVLAPRHVDTWLQPDGQFAAYRREFFSRLYDVQGVPSAEVERSVRELAALNGFVRPATVDITLEYGATCPVLPQFTVIHVPGHAQHAMGLWNAATGELISGDQLLPHISSNAFIEPELGARRGQEATRTESLIQYRNNLAQLMNLNISTVYPGHGPVFQHAQQLIQRRLDEQEQRLEEFLDRIRHHGSVSAYELAVDYFPRHTQQTSLIMSETLGYLDWIKGLGEVEEDEENSVVTWIKSS